MERCSVGASGHGGEGKVLPAPAGVIQVKFDVLMATDCRFPGGTTSSVVEEIEAQHRAGYRTGVLHLPSPVLGKPRPFAPRMRKVFEQGKAELVLGAERVEAALLLARHPTVFMAPPRDVPRLVADHVLLAVNQVASDDRGVLPYYDVPQVHRQLRRMTGQEVTWAPIGPRVRQSLEEHAASVPVLPWDWENVIDVTAWQVPRAGFVSDRPVIGRHSRGHWTKWPDTKGDILAAYPADPRYSVRILGGVDAPAQVLDRIPLNWVDLPFNSVPAREFLGSIDFFVYFHHPGLIEAFGRVVLEALSAGAVVVGPPYLEPLFGDACLYGTPADVRRYVDELYVDWEAFAARSRAGVELARRRFSYETHVDRVAKLIGDPATPSRVIDSGLAAPTARKTSGRAPAQHHQSPDDHQTRQRRTLVVDLRRDTGGTDLLPRVVAQLGDGPRAVVAPAWRVSDLALARDAADGADRPRGSRAGSRSKGGATADQRAADVLVETFPWVLAELSAPDRRRYLRRRLSGLVASHRPARIVVLASDGRDARLVQDAVGDTTVGDTTVDVAAEVLLVHRDTAPAPVSAKPLASGEAGKRIDSASTPSEVWALPDGWTVSRWPAGRPGTARPSLGWLARLRRKAPASSRALARRTMSALRRGRLRVLERAAPKSGLMLFEVADAELSLPVRIATTHPAPEQLPIALLVVTDDSVEPEPTLRAVAERAQMTTAFRPAVLAPPSWVDQAVVFDVTLETLVPALKWESAYGGEWTDYMRRRVDETCRVIHPTTVAFIESTIWPAGVSAGTGASSSVALDVLEATRTRRRA